jgi:hypothetical protein
VFGVKTSRGPLKKLFFSPLKKSSLLASSGAHDQLRRVFKERLGANFICRRELSLVSTVDRNELTYSVCRRENGFKTGVGAA